MKRSKKATTLRWRKIKSECFKRDGGVCQSCGLSYPEACLHPHHIIPAGRVRIDDLDNLLTVCVDCHRGIHDHLPGWPTVDELIERYRKRIERFLEDGRSNK